MQAEYAKLIVFFSYCLLLTSNLHSAALFLGQVKHALVVEAALDGWGQRRIAIAMPVRIVRKPRHLPDPAAADPADAGAAGEGPCVFEYVV